MANLAHALPSAPVWRSASTLLREEQAQKFVPLQLSLLKSLFPKGLTRGTIYELCGRRSSGKTSTSLNILAEATRQGEVCAIVDTQNSFHPNSALLARVELTHTVWVKCSGNSGHAVRAADLLLHAGGFGVVWLDLSEVQPQMLNKIPLSYWHRFRRAIENTSTILLVSIDSPQVKSSLSNSVELAVKKIHWSGSRPSVLLRSVETTSACRKTSKTNPNSLSFQLAV